MLTAAVMFLFLSCVISTGCILADEELAYRSISQEEAWEMMQNESDSTTDLNADLPLLVLDVRTAEEYEELHIPGAVLLPLDEIETSYEEMLPEKEQVILVYCRSGRRSKIASEFLTEAGYTNILEFGGIIDWIYETETGPYVETAPDSETEIETDDENCQHVWAEDCVGKICMKCGAYIRTAN